MASKRKAKPMNIYVLRVRSIVVEEHKMPATSTRPGALIAGRAPGGVERAAIQARPSLNVTWRVHVR
jgi:hypothetical protein